MMPLSQKNLIWSTRFVKQVIKLAWPKYMWANFSDLIQRGTSQIHMRWIECRWCCRQIEDRGATANWEPQGDGYPPSGVCVCVSMSLSVFLHRGLGGGARFVCCMEANSCMPWSWLGLAPNQWQAVIPCHDQRSVFFPSLSSPLCDVGWPSLFCSLFNIMSVHSLRLTDQEIRDIVVIALEFRLPNCCDRSSIRIPLS